MVQAVEHMLCQNKPLSSNPVPQKKGACEVTRMNFLKNKSKAALLLMMI
jgi:hypothetical protein